MHLLTPPASAPVTPAEAKLALRIDDTQYDALLPGLLLAATDVAQQETGRLFIEQAWRIELADWPASTDVLPLYRPTAAAVSYWNGSSWVALSGSAFAFGPDAVTGNGTVIAPALNTSWPALGDIAIGPRVRIDLSAGVAAADAAQVPSGVRTFITALVGQMIQSPELSASATVQAHPLLARLLDPWRLY